MSDTTRREDSGTRREGDDSGGRYQDRTRREGDDSGDGYQDGTRREGDDGDNAPLIRLPSSLEADYEVDSEATQTLDAEGGQAHLVVARGRDTGTRVVIKIYRRGTTLDERALERLVEMGKDDEGRAHVVPILRYGTAGGYPWEVQEYLSGGSLEKVLRTRGKVDSDFGAALVSELSTALTYIHAQAVTHRDLKPANVLLRTLEPLDLVVGDFGLATELALTEAVKSSMAGSWPYLPPESRGNTVSPAMDWWALGVIVVRSITGRHMFQDPDGPRMLPDAQIANQLYERTYTVPTSGDERWDLLIRGLLTHDRRRRWNGKQVAQWLAGESPEVYTETVPAGRTPGTVRPFSFAGSSYTDPVALADAFRSHWDEAAELLVGRGAEDLRMWLRKTEMGDAADHVLSGGVSSPERGLVRLQVIMDPASPPEFRGRELSQMGINKVIKNAANGKQPAVEWITALREERILSAWAAEADVPEDVRHADDRLLAWWRYADDVLAEAPDDLVASARPVLEARLLSASLSKEQAARVRRDGRTAAKKATTLPEWAVSLRNATLRKDAGPHHGALAGLLLRAAERTEVARLGAERKALRERDRRRTQTEGQAVQDTVAARASRRRGFDLVVFLLAIAAVVTVLLPWLIGRYVTRGYLGRSDTGVFDPSVRGAGDYFMTDWMSGSVVILTLAAAVMLVGPLWRWRGLSIVGAAALLVAGFAWLQPTSVQRWDDAEAASVKTLRTTKYPFGEEFFTCGGGTLWSKNNGIGSPVSAFTAHIQDTPDKGCNRVDIYRGWCKIGTTDLGPKQWTPPRNAVRVDKGKDVFRVRLKNGNRISIRPTDFPLAKKCSA